MDQIIVTKRNGTSFKLFSKSPACTVTSAVQTMSYMGDDYVQLSIKSAAQLNFTYGDKITINGRDYWLRSEVTREVNADDQFVYEAQFVGVMYELLKSQYRNTDANGFSPSGIFDLTGTLSDFVKLIPYNTDRDFPGLWEFDLASCPASDTKTLSFSKETCLAVLQRVVKEFEQEFIIDQVNGIRTLKIGKFGQIIAPPSGRAYFEHGKGKGLYNLKLQKVDDQSVITRLWVEGGTNNLKSDYRGYSQRLQLPLSIIGTEDKRYLEDATLKAQLNDTIEDTETFDDIFPRRTGAVTTLGSDLLSFIDSTMDFDLKEVDINGNTKWMISGTSPKLTFNTGSLAGIEFELSNYDHATKTFTIVEYTDSRGLKFPNPDSTAFRISLGDTYKITDINLPDSYVTAAENELYVAGLAKLNDRKQPRAQYAQSFDKMYFKKYLQAGGTVNVFLPGDFVPVKDTRFGIEKNIQIQTVSRNLLEDYDYALQLSDITAINIYTQTVLTVIDHNRTISNNQIKAAEQARQNASALSKLKDYTFDPDTGKLRTENIKVGSIDSLYLSVGTKSGNFELLGTIKANYDADPSKVWLSSALLIHKEINYANGDYTWELPANTLTLADPTKAYYLYAKCSVNSNAASWYATTDMLRYDNDTANGYYYFSIGVIFEVQNGIRADAFTYGKSIIHGGFIDADTITALGRVNSFKGLHLIDPTESGSDKYVFGATYDEALGSAYPELYVGRRRSANPAETASGFFVGRGADGKYKMHVGSDTSYFNWDGTALSVNGAVWNNAKGIDNLGSIVDLFEIHDGVICFRMPISSTGDIAAFSAYGSNLSAFDALSGTAPIVRTGSIYSLDYDPLTLGVVNGKLTVVGGGSVAIDVNNLTNYYNKTASDNRYKAIGWNPDLSAYSTKTQADLLYKPIGYAPDLSNYVLSSTLLNYSTKAAADLLYKPIGYAPDLSAYSTKAQADLLYKAIGWNPDLSAYSTKAAADLLYKPIGYSPDLSSYITSTALSTWAGTSYITSLGTIVSGVWHGSKIDDAYLSSTFLKAETDTLDTVLGRGNTTNKAIILNNGAKTFTLSVDSSGNLVMTSNTGNTAIVTSGDVIAFAGSNPVVSWWDALGGFVDGITMKWIGGKLVSVASGSGAIDVNVSNLTNYYTKTDIQNYLSGVSSIAGYNKSNWDTAYTNNHIHSNKSFLDSLTAFAGSGSAGTIARSDHNHTGTYLASETDPIFTAWNKSSGISITKSQVSDFGTYSTDIHSNITALNAVSGTNTGDNAVNTLYSGLVSNATHTGDATGSTALTVVKIQGISVDATTPTTGDYLNYNGSSWVHSGLTNTSVGLSNVTNNAQWYSGNHPTTVAGYGITDIPTYSGSNFILNQSSSAQTGNAWLNSWFRGSEFNAYGNSNSGPISKITFTDKYETGNSRNWGIFNGYQGYGIWSLQVGTTTTSDPATGTTALQFTNTGAATFSSSVSASQFTSTITTGTSPFTVASTTMVGNLNSQLWGDRSNGFGWGNQTSGLTGIGGMKSDGLFYTYDANAVKSFLGLNSLATQSTSSLTTNYLPKWNGSALVNSLISDDGTTVTSTPTSNVSPTLGNAGSGFKVTGSSGLYGVNININPSGYTAIQAMRFDGVATAYDLYLQPLGGNVQIPSTTASTSSTTGALVVRGGIGSGQINASINDGGNSWVPIITMNNNSAGANDWAWGKGIVNDLGLKNVNNDYYAIYFGNGGTFTDAYLNGGLHIGGTAYAGDNNLIVDGYTFIGYTSDPTSGNKLAVNGNAYINGILQSIGSMKAPAYEIKDASGTTQWTLTVGSGNNLEIRNASNVLVSTFSQSGLISAKDDVGAFCTI